MEWLYVILDTMWKDRKGKKKEYFEELATYGNPSFSTESWWDSHEMQYTGDTYVRLVHGAELGEVFYECWILLRCVFLSGPEWGGGRLGSFAP